VSFSSEENSSSLPKFELPKPTRVIAEKNIYFLKETYNNEDRHRQLWAQIKEQLGGNLLSTRIYQSSHYIIMIASIRFFVNEDKKLEDSDLFVTAYGGRLKSSLFNNEYIEVLPLTTCKTLIRSIEF